MDSSSGLSEPRVRRVCTKNNNTFTFYRGSIRIMGSTCCGSGDSVCGAYVDGAKTTAAVSGLVVSFVFVAFSALL